MLSGVEVAGLVLAIMPLCTTALEHHQDEIRSYKALFRYEKQLSLGRSELYFVQTSFTTTIRNLCQDAAVADSGQFEEMLNGTTAKVWSSNEADCKLEQLLTEQVYYAYKVKAVAICRNIMKVASILGLDEKSLLSPEGMEGFRSDPWMGVASAKLKATAAKKVAYRDLRERVKFILKGGTLGRLVKEIAEDTQQLDRLIEKSSRPHIVPPHTGRYRLGEPFLRSTQAIEVQARLLHRALEDVWSCSKHQNHCVNLRLERRLHRDRVPDDRSIHRVSFTLALKPSQIWRSFEVNMVEDNCDGSGHAVNRQVSDGASTPTTSSHKMTVDDLCQHVNAHSCFLSLCPDHGGRLFADSSRTTSTSMGAINGDTQTLKSLLETSQHPQITAKQSMQLALTLVSSFLQLQSTPWLKGRWCIADVILLSFSPKPDIGCPCISQTYPLENCDGGTHLSDSDKIFALGTMLLQITTQTIIEKRRTVDSAMQGDPFIVRSYLQDEADSWLDCFAESIAACSNFYHSRFDLDLADTVTRNEVIEAVLYPFQRDLKLL